MLLSQIPVLYDSRHVASIVLATHYTIRWNLCTACNSLLSNVGHHSKYTMTLFQSRSDNTRTPTELHRRHRRNRRHPKCRGLLPKRHQLWTYAKHISVRLHAHRNYRKKRKQILVHFIRIFPADIRRNFKVSWWHSPIASSRRPGWTKCWKRTCWQMCVRT